MTPLNTQPSLLHITKTIMEIHGDTHSHIHTHNPPSFCQSNRLSVQLLAEVRSQAEGKEIFISSRIFVIKSVCACVSIHWGRILKHFCSCPISSVQTDVFYCPQFIENLLKRNPEMRGQFV